MTVAFHIWVPLLPEHSLSHALQSQGLHGGTEVLIIQKCSLMNCPHVKLVPTQTFIPMNTILAHPVRVFP